MDSERFLIGAFLEDHPADAAHVLERLPAADSAELLAEFSVQTAGEVVRKMSAFGGSAAIAAMDEKLAATLIAHMPVQDASALLRYRRGRPAGWWPRLAHRLLRRGRLGGPSPGPKAQTTGRPK